jgi:hypothetical protein
MTMWLAGGVVVKLRKHFRRVGRHWPMTMLVLALGVLIGLLVSLPLFPDWRLSGEVLALLGSVVGAGLGAGIAVLGSFKVLRDERRQGDEQICHALELLLESITSKFNEFFASIDPGNIDGKTIDADLMDLGQYMESQVFVMDRIQSHFSHLGPFHMQVVIDAEQSIRKIAEIVGKMAAGGHVFYFANNNFQAQLKNHLGTLRGVSEWLIEFEPGER